MDISQRWMLRAGPKGVCLRETVLMVNLIVQAIFHGYQRNKERMNFTCFGLYWPVCTYINKLQFFETLVFRRNFKAVCKLCEVGFVKPKLPQLCLLHREGSYKCLDAKFKTFAIFFQNSF